MSGGGARRIAACCALAVGAVGAVASGVLVASGVSAAPGAHAQGGESTDALREVATRADDGTAIIDVIVPRQTSAVDLPPGSFEANVAGIERSVESSHFVDVGVVDLVIDPLSDTDRLTSIQGAVAEFLLALDSRTPVTIHMNDETQDVGTDRALALSALERMPVAGNGGASNVRATDVFVANPTSTGSVERQGRAVVVVSDTSPAGFVDRLTSSAATDAPSSMVVWQVSSLDGQLTRTPISSVESSADENSTGDAGAASTSVLAALDRVAEEISGSYRLTVPGVMAGSDLGIQLTTRTGTTSMDVTVSNSAPAADAPADDTSGGSSSSLPPVAEDASEGEATATGEGGGPGALLAVVGIAALLVVAAAVLTLLRMRRTGAAGDQPTPGVGGATERSTPSTPQHSANGHVPATAAAAPSAGFGRSDLDRLADEVDRRFDRLTARRRRSLRPVSIPVLVAVESTASAWIDDPTVRPDEVVRLLDPVGGAASDAVSAVQRAMFSTLSMGSTRNAELSSQVRAVLELGRPSTNGNDQHTIDIREPVADRGDELSLLDEVVTAATVELGSSSSVSDGPVQRCLLSTWPARHGRLQGVPLVLSPSLFGGGPGALGSTPSVQSVASAVLVAMCDSLARMELAEAAFDTVHHIYRDTLRADAIDATETAIADRVASLVTQRPVLDITSASTVLQLSDDDSLAVLDHLAERGWLERLPGADGSGAAPRWFAHQVISGVTAAFAESVDTSIVDAVDVTNISGTQEEHHVRS